MNSQSKPNVYKTRYDRAACSTGVVHLGFGAFHRAHQAVYLDDYMEATGDLRWGIAAVNLRGEESAQFARNIDAASPYVLKSIATDGQVALRSVRSHVGFVDWARERAQAEALLTSDDVHMVTITVTESGYYTDPNGALNTQDALIAAEIRGEEGKSVYAYLSAALSQRMQAGGGPITILCCDNIRQNGKMLRANLAAYLEHTSQDALAVWVANYVTFPCSMVDRITPRSTPEFQNEIDALLGAQPVQSIMAEAFSQWVLEENFAGPMPDLAKAGVTVTSDVDPYEEAKIRILNGGHTSLAYLGALHGIETFDAAMNVPELFDHFWSYETKEVLPGLTLALPFDKLAYLESISQRFKNAAIADTISRICADGMVKFPIFIRPTLEGCLEQGILPENGIRAIASWYVFARHVVADKIGFKYEDPSWDLLKPMLEAANRDSFIHSQHLWGDLPQRFPQFADALGAGLDEMDAKWPV